MVVQAVSSLVFCKLSSTLIPISQSATPYLPQSLTITTSPALSALQAAFPAEQIALPGSERFNARIKSYLSLLQSEITPSTIFLPKNKEEVTSFLKILQEHRETFTIRGGGQQPLPGCSNIKGSITLNLINITGVDLNDKNNIMSIGPGKRWGTIYKKLHKKGLSVTGARSGNNSIRGLALSGSLSFFSSRKGLVYENMENTDLFKSLRGSSNNFSIITRFNMRTFKQGPFWGGTIFYFPDQFSAQIDALVDELRRPDTSEEAHIMISLFFAAQIDQVLGLNQVYYTQEVQTPPDIQPFVAIQPQMDQLNSIRMVTVKAAAEEQAAVAMTGVQCAYINTIVKADSATLKATAKVFSEALKKVKGFEGVIFSFILQPYPLSLLKKTSRFGGNIMNLNSKNGPLISILILIY
ncbi:unnamed protein product [Clonostachys chloroleuca]|uniref:FAD-binding PCMH-type domain-containing protein n=1 Tax=Clonostachys chloroleuca TaxID=1926264 RepID=A0AA35M0L3_9HYPO|nr:unnamed protein product [Clonostachys chloroleuca]